MNCICTFNVFSLPTCRYFNIALSPELIAPHELVFDVFAANPCPPAATVDAVAAPAASSWGIRTHVFARHSPPTARPPPPPPHRVATRPPPRLMRSPAPPAPRAPPPPYYMDDRRLPLRPRPTLITRCCRCGHRPPPPCAARHVPPPTAAAASTFGGKWGLGGCCSLPRTPGWQRSGGGEAPGGGGGGGGWLGYHAARVMLGHVILLTPGLSFAGDPMSVPGQKESDWGHDWKVSFQHKKDSTRGGQPEQAACTARHGG